MPPSASQEDLQEIPRMGGLAYGLAYGYSASELIGA